MGRIFRPFGKALYEVFRTIGLFIYRLSGWKVEGSLPPVKNSW